ncbi:hypothetical protein PN36_25910 [Candidatus Thiomargarita nelsonii]|uniref:Uncharacterized protein n=1 Tax=Candidatus Thiomargarita nelsonii TaxID=1003181 RepID=A0A4E0QLZ1_9GAMM|nr:hypothetical protein PN36_25910 [Candidatus Thiomargarita nelsonii]
MKTNEFGTSTLSICFFWVGVQSFSFVLSDKAKALYSKKNKFWVGVQSFSFVLSDKAKALYSKKNKFWVGVQSFSFVLSDKAKALYSKKTNFVVSGMRSRFPETNALPQFECFLKH